MSQKYVIETFGCQMNFHDAERMAGLLEQAGYQPAASAEDADLVVVNTCSVREKAEDKLYTRLGELRAFGADGRRAPVVAVTGCVAQQEGAAILQRSNLVDIVLGTQRIKQLPALADQALGRTTPEVAEGRRLPVVDTATPYDDVSFAPGTTKRLDAVRAWVTIIEGCNDFCAFCVVPYTRGHERMRPKAEILEDVRAAVAAGRPEVQLLGQIVNHYQAPDDPSCDFPALLEAVHAVPGVQRIRFASPHPRHCSDRLIAAVRDLPKVCKHLHLPVQSGSSAVLARMRRRHTREEYLVLVDRIRAAIPNVQLSTDMIVGFPGETAAEFDETLTLTAAVGYHSMFSFKYSERPNTLAAKRLPDDVPEAEKTRRIVALQSLQREVQGRLLARLVGRTEDVLVDGASRRREWELKGRTSGNTVVNFPGDPGWVGRTVPVTIRRAGPNAVWGEALVPEPAGAGRA